jgi:hypothetical protein
MVVPFAGAVILNEVHLADSSYGDDDDDVVQRCLSPHLLLNEIVDY